MKFPLKEKQKTSHFVGTNQYKQLKQARISAILSEKQAFSPLGTNLEKGGVKHDKNNS